MRSTFDILPADGFDGYVVVGGPVVALEYLPVLPGPYLSAQHVVIYQLRHQILLLSNPSIHLQSTCQPSFKNLEGKNMP